MGKMFKFIHLNLLIGSLQVESWNPINKNKCQKIISSEHFLCKPIWSSQWQTQISLLDHLLDCHFLLRKLTAFSMISYYCTQFAVQIRVLITSHDSWSIFTFGPFLLIDASTFNNPVQFHLKMNPWKMYPNCTEFERVFWNVIPWD